MTTSHTAPTLASVPPANRVATRPVRADGRRNYDALLQAARKAFAARGTSASLDEIAAGVAIGTLYGHFPTRDALLEAATRDELAGLLALDVDAEPLTGLRTWVLHAVAFCSTYRGFVSTVAQGAHDEASLWREGCHAMETRGAELLAAAQRAGRVRREVTPVELFDLVGAAAWLRENAGPDHDGSTRLVDYVLDGISRP
jgi:AcrR family transcriptional regulator